MAFINFASMISALTHLFLRLTQSLSPRSGVIEVTRYPIGANSPLMITPNEY